MPSWPAWKPAWIAVATRSDLAQDGDLRIRLDGPQFVEEVGRVHESRARQARLQRVDRRALAGRNGISTPIFPLVAPSDFAVIAAAAADDATSPASRFRCPIHIGKTSTAHFSRPLRRL